jgi:hypothetical protein
MSKGRQMGWFQTNTVRVARLHFFYVLVFAVSIIAYDAWKLITSQALIERWTLAVVMLSVTTIVWFLARNTSQSMRVYQLLLFAVIAMDILFAGYAVYFGRGMSSRGVALFAIPIVVSAVTLSRSAIYATATLCTGAYTYAALKYFTDNPSEGYKVELYGDLLFYAATFFLLASLLWTLARSVQAKTSKG